MDVAVVIVEQLDADGALRTFRLQSDNHFPITVAFAGEYEEPRSGPFHFLDERNEQRFAQAFAECKVRKLSSTRFAVQDGFLRFRTSWTGIPTERQRLSYYALCLPQWTVPIAIRATDPRSGREFRKVVQRDDHRGRFVVYLECRSSHGTFDFELDVQCQIDSDTFASAEYVDATSSEYGANPDAYEYMLNGEGRTIVQQFFSEFSVGHQYNISGQAGAVGPNASASHNSFNQIYQQAAAGIDLAGLADELASLRASMRKEASDIEHDKAIASVGEAEIAARHHDGAGAIAHLKAAGKWALDAATDIGASIAADIIKKAIGLP